MSDHDQEHKHHIVTPALYARVFGVLVVLLLLTVGAASLDLGSGGNVAVAMAIAMSKALFILLFFMHIKYSSNLTRLFAACGFIWFAILVAFVMQDFVTRDLMGAIFDVYIMEPPGAAAVHH